MLYNVKPKDPRSGDYSIANAGQFKFWDLLHNIGNNNLELFRKSWN